MRTIITILVFLLLTGWVLSKIEITTAEGTVVGQSDASQWRRTAHGWDQVENWKSIVPPSINLHPGIVGLFILLISVFSLIGFETPSAKSPLAHEKTRPSAPR